MNYFCFCIIFAVRTLDSKYFDLVQRKYILNFRQIDNLKRFSGSLHPFSNLFTDEIRFIQLGY